MCQYISNIQISAGFDSLFGEKNVLENYMLHWGRDHVLLLCWDVTSERHVCYHKTSNVSRTLVTNDIVNHSDVIGGSTVGAAPTTSSSSTKNLTSME